MNFGRGRRRDLSGLCIAGLAVFKARPSRHKHMVVTLRKLTHYGRIRFGDKPPWFSEPNLLVSFRKKRRSEPSRVHQKRERGPRNSESAKLGVRNTWAENPNKNPNFRKTCCVAFRSWGWFRRARSMGSNHAIPEKGCDMWPTTHSLNHCATKRSCIAFGGTEPVAKTGKPMVFCVDLLWQSPLVGALTGLLPCDHSNGNPGNVLPEQGLIISWSRTVQTQSNLGYSSLGTAGEFSVHSHKDSHSPESEGKVFLTLVPILSQSQPSS